MKLKVPESGLLLRDTLQYVAFVLVAYGVGSLEADFVKAVVALVLGAGIVVLRMLLKQAGYETPNTPDA